MGKAGRFACVFVPMALTVASLVCIILVGMGGTNKSSSTLNNLYFFKADTSNITLNSAIDIVPGTNVDNNLLHQGLQQAKSTLNLKDFYTVSLWNYCDGSKANSSSTSVETVEFCSPRQSEFWFNPVEVWGLNNTGLEQVFPKELKDGLNAYQTASKWMFIAYVVAFVATALELIVGFFAVFSRWGSFATTVVSVASALFILAASLTATLVYSTLSSSFNSYLKPYNIHGSLGQSMYVTTWLAVAFSFGAAIFWLFSVCCCSGRSGNDGKKTKRVNVERTPYTYERVASPYLGQSANANSQRASASSGSGVPLQGVGHGGKAYEPYRHENV
ncbi:MAG: hypothetical protein M1830_008305 [Pleopsidium flavum]|nr:MAG: hypothetical protein M1830_008305 [Pleopsidium flavum]